MGDVDRPWVILTVIVSESSRPFWIKAGELNARQAISKSRPGGSGYGA